MEARCSPHQTKGGKNRLKCSVTIQVGLRVYEKRNCFAGLYTRVPKTISFKQIAFLVRTLTDVLGSWPENISPFPAFDLEHLRNPQRVVGAIQNTHTNTNFPLHQEDMRNVQQADGVYVT